MVASRVEEAQAQQMSNMPPSKNRLTTNSCCDDRNYKREPAVSHQNTTLGYSKSYLLSHTISYSSENLHLLVLCGKMYQYIG